MLIIEVLTQRDFDPSRFSSKIECFKDRLVKKFDFYKNLILGQTSRCISNIGIWVKSRILGQKLEFRSKIEF